MSLFGQIKCGRCDRRYSGARTKCPYCGARKSRSGRRIDTTDANTKWKALAALIILFLIIVAVVVIILVSVGKKDKPADNVDPNPGTSEPGGIDSVENSPLPSINPSPSVEPSPSPSAPVIQDLILNREDFTLFSVGESHSLDPQTVPTDVDVTITWTSSDESVALVDLYGKVTAIGDGTCTITAEADGIVRECIVRVSLD